MCEILAVTWPEPRPFATIAPWARALEFYGSGRFGWGVAWTEGGQVKVHKDTGQLADDPAAGDWLGAGESRHFLVHSRPAALLATIQLADIPPLLQQQGRHA